MDDLEDDVDKEWDNGAVIIENWKSRYIFPPQEIGAETSTQTECSYPTFGHAVDQERHCNANRFSCSVEGVGATHIEDTDI